MRKKSVKVKLAMIGNQAFSLINFRGLLIKSLVKSGVEVFALAPDYNEATRIEVRNLGANPIDYSLSRTGMNPFRDVPDILRLTFTLRKLNVDISFSYFAKPVIYGSIAARLAGVPFRAAMIEGLGYAFTENEDAMSWQRRTLRLIMLSLYKYSLFFAQKVIFLNDDDMNEFIEKNVLEKGKAIKIGGIGVDLDEWRHSSPISDPITFILAARLLREKGIIEYAEAAAIVKRDYPNSRFILLGGIDPNPGGVSREEIEKWVYSGVLEWPGHVDVKPWYEQASVFVLPSYYREGLPRSTQEAMAMGLPVITTDVVGCRDTVIDGENGFLVEAKNSQQLSDKMKCYIEKPELIDMHGYASRRIAERKYDVNKVNDKIMDILQLRNL